MINKSYPSRYDFGVKTIEHKGVKVTTSLNTSIEAIIDKIPNNINHKVGVCLPFIAHRPDLVSDLFYDTTGYWWYFQLVNNIKDPFEELNPGDIILIPSIDSLGV